MIPNIPWSIDHDRIKDATGREVARIAPRLHGSQNRSLIVAAPELLTALEGLVSDWERVTERTLPDDHEAKAAIAKAKGGAK